MVWWVSADGQAGGQLAALVSRYWALGLFRDRCGQEGLCFFPGPCEVVFCVAGELNGPC